MADNTRGYIEIRDPHGAVTRVQLQQGRMVIGRAADAAIRLDSATVSRHHAEIVSDSRGGWLLHDLKSRNGTLLRGQPILEHTLQSGDTFQIEDFTLTLRMPTVAPTASPPPSGSFSSVTLLETGSPVRPLRELEAPRIAASHLSALTQFGTTLLNTESDQERLAALCRLMVSKEFNGTTACVLRLRRDQGEDATPELVAGPESSTRWRAGELPYVSRTILRAVQKNQTPVVASNVGTTGAIEMSLVSNAPAMAAIACPLRSDVESMDLLYVTFPVEYGNPEWLALAALATEQFEQADAAWAARRASQAQALVEQELRHAHNIQMRLVPRNLDVPGVDVTIGFEPCRWVGGDYVDAVPRADGRLLLTVADVCGKGLQAALISASLHSMIHTNAHPQVTLAELMQRLNDYLCSMLPDDSFVTMASVLLDPRTGEMECVNAGHPPPMVVERGGAVRQLPSAENPPLGFMPLQLAAQRDVLPPGHVLALYTDGLSELCDPSGNMLGIDQLGEHLRTACAGNGDAGTAAAIAGRLRHHLDEFRGPMLAQDDRTFLLACRC